MAGGNKALRERMLNHKVFLETLYFGNARKNKLVLKHASEEQLKLLLEILSQIATAQIPIHQLTVNKVKRARRLPKLKDIMENLECYLNMTAETQQKKLFQFVSLFPDLLKPLFNK